MKTFTFLQMTYGRCLHCFVLNALEKYLKCLKVSSLQGVMKCELSINRKCFNKTSSYARRFSYARLID